MLIRATDLWSSEVKKMPTMQVPLLPTLLISHFFLSSYEFQGFDHQLVLQAIKVLNMIKLFGKPIRVNKVLTQLTMSLFFIVLLNYDISCWY